MCSHQGDRLGMVAVGQGDAGIGSAGRGSRDAGHHLEANAAPRQFLEFLAAATEHEWVPALESHHAPPRTSVLHQQLVDAGLWNAMHAGRLPHRDPLGIPPGQVEDLIRHESIVKDDVSFLQRPQCIQGEQAGIPRTRTHQNDRPRLAVLPVLQGDTQLRFGCRDPASLD